MFNDDRFFQKRLANLHDERYLYTLIFRNWMIR